MTFGSDGFGAAFPRPSLGAGGWHVHLCRAWSPSFILINENTCFELQRHNHSLISPFKTIPFVLFRALLGNV